MTQSKITENRQQIVRARKYYDDYRVQLRAKMMRMRTREEMVNTGVLGFLFFKTYFREGERVSSREGQREEESQTPH